MILLIILLKKERERLDPIKLDVLRHVWEKRCVKGACACVSVRGVCEGACARGKKGGSSVRRPCSVPASTWKDAIFHLLRPDVRGRSAATGCQHPAPHIPAGPCSPLSSARSGGWMWTREPGPSLTLVSRAGWAGRYRHQWQARITAAPRAVGGPGGRDRVDSGLGRRGALRKRFLNIAVPVTCCRVPYSLLISETFSFVNVHTNVLLWSGLPSVRAQRYEHRLLSWQQIKKRYVRGNVDVSHTVD